MGALCCCAAPAPTPEVAEAQAKEVQQKGGPALPVGEFKMKEDRSCTDCLFLLLFIAFWGLMIFIGIIGFVNGNVARLSNGYDFNGNVCGQGNFSDRSFLYYANPFPNASNGDIDLSWGVCVKTCPYILRTPPDMCSTSFQVLTQSGLTQSGSIITCGGNADGSTNMKQFSLQDQILYTGYKKYCLGRVPMCTCRTGNVSISASCCDVNTPQAYIAGIPQTAPNTGAAASIAGVTIGYNYGYCFYAYPTMSVSGLSRCLPLPPDTLTLTNGSVSVSFSNILAASSNSNATASTSNQGLANATLSSAFNSVLNAASNPQETFTSLVNEVYQQHWLIIGSAGLALLISLLYTQLLRFTIGIFTYAVVIFLWLLLFAATVILAVKTGLISPSQVPAVVGSTASSISLPSGLTFGQAQTNQDLLSAATAVVGTCFLLYTVALIILIPRINVAIEVIKQAGECISAMPSALIFPVFIWIAICALFVWWVAVLLFLTSSGTWDQTTHTFSWNDTIRRSLIFHCFGLLWGRAFIIAVGNIIIAGAATEWYLAEPKQGIFTSAMRKSIHLTFRYHLGTAAFGSFLIAVVQFIRWIFRYYVYQVNKLNPNNRVVKILTCIGECCLACLERFMNFVNKNAFIQTAIEGTSFCYSAGAAFSLLLRNFLRLGALTIIAAVFLNMGKLLIAALTGFVCALIAVGGDMKNIAQAPLFSIIIIMLLAFAIASAFMDVWEMVIDTLFQCYCIDLERGGGESRHATGAMKELVAKNKDTAPADVKGLAGTLASTSKPSAPGQGV